MESPSFTLPEISLKLDPWQKFDRDLMLALGCLKALNLRHISWIGKEIDNILDEKAYQILWHLEQPVIRKSFDRLKKLHARSLVLPWRLWSPDHILLNSMGRANVRKSDVFFILGKAGREWLKKKLNIKMQPHIVEELYQSVFPIAVWLTASSCALTLQSQGYILVPIDSVWRERLDVMTPRFKPEFIVKKDISVAFYILESPFGLRAENFVSHVGRGLNFMISDSIAVILTRTPAAFSRIFRAMSGNCLSSNKSGVYVGDLNGFYKSRGHSTLINGEEKQITL